jgi:hypothetical protein
MTANSYLTRPAFLLQMLAVVLGLFFVCPSNAKPPSVPEGAALHKLVVGVWKFKIDDKLMKGNGLTEYKADGTMTSKATFEMLGEKVPLDLQGKWKIEGSKLTWEVTKTNDPELFAVGEKATEQILAIDAKTMRYRDEDGLIWEEERQP